MPQHAAQCLQPLGLLAKASPQHRLRHPQADLDDAPQSKKLACGCYGHLHTQGQQYCPQVQLKSEPVFHQLPTNQTSVRGFQGATQMGNCRVAKLLKIVRWCRLPKLQQALRCSP